MRAILTLRTRIWRYGDVFGSAILCLTGVLNLALGANEQSGNQILELEEFISEETALEESDTLLPTERAIDSVFGSPRTLLETPRAVTVINPESMKEFDIDNVYELADFVPGASVINYYGLPGIPTTRGLFSSVYFNGMLRVWNRNGYPTSFGSLESLDFVRGPAPAFYSAATPGGYVNFIPKSPYFDEFRGALRFTYGSYSHFNSQIDIGGPRLIGERPAAWRISVTIQDSEAFHDDINDDYISLYGAMKMKVSKKLSIFLGGEYYQHRSNENPGWNRVTQELIDRNQYVIGEPLNDLTGAEIQIPIALPFSGGDSPDDFLVTNSTPGIASREVIEMMSPFGGIRGGFGFPRHGRRFSEFNPSTFTPEQQTLFAFIGGLNNTGNPFCPCFTGEVQTVIISPKWVLADEVDFANADTFLFFFDTEFEKNENWKITNKLFVDTYERSKQSSYGYAEFGENFTLENKIVVEHKLPNLGSGSTLIYGGAIRYEDALALTDFTSEPFSRRDITKPVLPNERVAAGSDQDINGENFWDPFGSFDTKMVNYGSFLTADLKFGEKFTLFLSGRVDHSNWDRRVADQAQGNRAGQDLGSGGKTYFSWSVSPLYLVSSGVSFYATYQEGTSYQGFYVSGGIHQGDVNFSQASLAEAGVKMNLWEDTFYASFDIFHQDLVQFDTRGSLARPQRGRGIEFETVYSHNEWLSILFNCTWQEHFFRSSGLPGGFIPLSEKLTVLYAGGLYADFGNVSNRPNRGARFGLPEWSINAYLRIKLPNGISIGMGPRYIDSIYANVDKTLRVPNYIVWNGRIEYATEKWEIALSATNIFEERYFIVQESFAGNTIIKHMPFAEWKATFRYKF